MFLQQSNIKTQDDWLHVVRTRYNEEELAKDKSYLKQQGWISEENENGWINSTCKITLNENFVEYLTAPNVSIADFSKKLWTSYKQLVDEEGSEVFSNQKDLKLEDIERALFAMIREGNIINKEAREAICLHLKQSNFFDAHRIEQWKCYPILLYKVIVWDTLFHLKLWRDESHSHIIHYFRKVLLPVIVYTSKDLMSHVYEVIVVMAVRQEKSKKMKKAYACVKNVYVEVLNSWMELKEMDDHVLSSKIFGLNFGSLNSAQLFSNENPIGLAVHHSVGICLDFPPIHDIINHVWYGDLYMRMINHDSIQMNGLVSSMMIKDISFQSYRKIPALNALTSLVWWLVFMSLTYWIIWDDDPNSNSFEPLHNIVVFLLFGFFWHTFATLIRKGVVKFFSSPWHLADLIIVVAFVLWVVCRSHRGIENAVAYRVLSVTSICMLFRVLQFTSTNRQHGIFVIVLLSMLRDVVNFMYIFCLVVWGFAIIFYGIFREMEVFSTFSSTLTTLFGCSLGKFHYGWFQEHPSGLGETLLTVYLIISTVILLNLLIAILTQTYEELTSQKAQQWALSNAKFTQSFIGGETTFPAPLSWISYVLNALCDIEAYCWPKGCVLRFLKTAVYCFLDFAETFSIVMVPCLFYDCCVMTWWLFHEVDIISLQFKRKRLASTSFVRNSVMNGLILLGDFLFLSLMFPGAVVCFAFLYPILFWIVCYRNGRKEKSVNSKGTDEKQQETASCERVLNRQRFVIMSSCLEISKDELMNSGEYDAWNEPVVFVEKLKGFGKARSKY